MTNYENENISESSYNSHSDLTKELFIKNAFEYLSPKSFRRVNFDKKIYDVYSDKESFKSIVAESALSAISDGEIKSPYKIINTSCIMPDIINTKELEQILEPTFKEQDSSANEIADPPPSIENDPSPPIDNEEVVNDESTEEN